MTSEHPADLIHGYFDDTLSADDLRQLTQWLAADVSHARQFAAVAMLHDRLHNEWASLGGAELVEPAPLPRRRHRIGSWAVAAALLVNVGTMLWHTAGPAPASAAMVQLNRVVAAFRQSSDRAYAISAGSGDPSTDTGKPEIDGARLYVRGDKEYVLVRYYPDGATFVTGRRSRHSTRPLVLPR